VGFQYGYPSDKPGWSKMKDPVKKIGDRILAATPNTEMLIRTAMNPDSAYEHAFGFNEAISFLVLCTTQREIDHHWSRLTAAGGQEGVCGWLKDRFGVSWQVAPAALHEMPRNPDKTKVERVTNAFLKMKKFDLAQLRAAYEG
jgi:predicted 3-demethylubiquinone-9 3-methyltransferase (glyoxalase superfamily)